MRDLYPCAEEQKQKYRQIEKIINRREEDTRLQ